MNPLTNTQIPTGALSGLFAGKQAAQAEMLNDVSLQTNEEKLRRDIAMNPLDLMVREKEAAFAQDEMNNNAYRDMRMQGLIGESQSKMVKGNIDYSTMDSSIKRQIAENIQKASDADIESTINALDMFTSTATQGGPAGLAMALQNLPEQYRAFAAQVQQSGQDPVKLAGELSNLIKSARADSAAQRGRIQVENVKGEWDVKKQRIASDATRYAADRQGSAMEKAEAANRRAMAVALVQQEAKRIQKEVEAVLFEKVAAGKDKTKIDAADKKLEALKEEWAFVQKKQKDYMEGKEPDNTPIGDFPTGADKPKPKVFNPTTNKWE